MSSITPSDYEIIPYLRDNCFNGDQQIAEIVQDYNQGLSIPFLVENIVKKIKSFSSSELLTFIASSIASTPTLAKLDLRDVEQLKKVCLYIHENKYAFFGADRFNGFKITTVATLALFRINMLTILNNEDPISREEIEATDLVIISSGQRFSVTNLIEYHNARDYRGRGRGEEYGNKFLFNPLTSEYFSFADTREIIKAAIKAGIPIKELHKKALAHKSSPYSKFASLKDLYASMQESSRRRSLTQRTLTLHSTQKGWAKLPQDFFNHILSFLPEIDVLLNVHRVCKEWSQIPLANGHLDLSSVPDLSNAKLKSILRYVKINNYQVTSINLSGCSTITNDALEMLKGLPLTSLNLSKCECITPDALGALQGMPLTNLDLSSWETMTDEALKALKDFPLKTLKLEGCRNITNNGLKHLQGMKLTSLSLLNCSKINHMGLAYLKGMLLTSLNLSGCDHVSTEELACLKGMPLTFLNLSGCPKINDACLKHLQGMLLTSLHLAWCDKITDRGISYLMDLSLTFLDLDGCSNLSNKGLSHLQGMPLTSLNLSNNENYTIEGLSYLKEKPFFYLNLNECSSISFEEATAFKEILFPTALLDRDVSLAEQSVIDGALARLNALYGEKISDRVDSYIYRMSLHPQGVDKWEPFDRYKDIGHFKLALASAVVEENDQELFNASFVPAALNILELTSGPTITVEQRKEIDALLEKMHPKKRASIDLRILGPLKAGTQKRDAEELTHRFDDLSRLRSAVVQTLNEDLLPVLEHLPIGTIPPAPSSETTEDASW